MSDLCHLDVIFIVFTIIPHFVLMLIDMILDHSDIVKKEGLTDQGTRTYANLFGGENEGETVKP